MVSIRVRLGLGLRIVVYKLLEKVTKCGSITWLKLTNGDLIRRSAPLRILSWRGAVYYKFDYCCCCLLGRGNSQMFRAPFPYMCALIYTKLSLAAVLRWGNTPTRCKWTGGIPSSLPRLLACKRSALGAISRLHALSPDGGLGLGLGNFCENVLMCLMCIRGCHFST